MILKEIMSRETASVSSDDSIETAAQLMKQYNVSLIPVCSQNNVIGIITDRDITLRSVASGQDSKHVKVVDVMTSNPVTGSPYMNAHSAVKLMSENQIHSLPIVENDSFVGMVTLGDISVEPNLQGNAEEELKSISQLFNTFM